MAKKKLSTAEILAKARAEAAGQSEQETAEEKPSESAASEQQQAAESEQPQQAQAEPRQSAEDEGEAQAAPKSTKDILAAARAQGGAGAAENKGEKTEAAQKKEAAAESKPSKKPASTKDILAAARAQAGSKAGKAQPEAKQAAAPQQAREKKTSPKAPPSKPPGERPSVQEMVRAAREGRKLEGEPQAALPVPAAKAKPAAARKPAPVERKKGEPQTRRWALLAMLVAIVASPFSLAWWAFGIASGLFSLALLRFMMPNVLVEPPSKFKVGPPSDYPLDTVSTKWKSQFGVWLVHTVYGGRNVVYALASICTHLGCTPNWLEGEQKFKCPCHGSGFYISGINFEGPAPRPLERYAIRLAPDGMLEVDKSATFQQEMGQWEDPASYVEVA